MAKVVHLTTVHSAGDVRIFHKECRSLARAGHDVVLLVPYTHSDFVDGVQIKALSAYRNRAFRMTGGIARIWRCALQEHADVYHFHDPELLLVGLVLALNGKAVIYDVHEDLPLDIRDKDYLPSWLRPALSKFAEMLEEVCSRRVAALVPATTSIAERVAKFNRRTVIVQNYPELTGPDLDPVPWNARPMWVAYVGGLNAVRGGVELIRAMGLISTEVQATLQLAGPYSREFRRQMQQIPGWSRVSEHGVVARTRATELLRRCRAGLVVNHPIRSSVSSEPNKMFEYMAAGIPVIASDFPDWREIIQREKCGLTVNPLDPQSIAEAIEYVLTHEEEAREMGLRGLHAVQSRYNWRVAEARLLVLYSELLGQETTAATPFGERAVV